jgi:putative PIG3 family NAD(P)H quinone oxidoreductase
VCEHPGGPEELQLSEVSEPRVGPGDVLIDVVAAGVNRADLLQRQGRYPPPPGASPVLGLECSGRISALGPGVEGWVVGDEVCALLTGGGYAQQVVVPSGQLLMIPRGVSLVDAAALPEAACTVWSNLVMAAHLSRGESLLVHGGGSGIGTMAIQIARMRGAIPIVTVGSDRKAEFCRALGAEVVINHHDEDFVEVVRETTDGRGADVVLDIIGAKYLGANVRALASDGRLVIIGLQGGVKAELDLGRLLSRRLSVIGTTLRSRSAAAKAEIVSEVATQLWPAVAEGAVRPVVDRVLPWQQAAEAHRLLERGETIGKVVLQVADAVE